METGKTETKTEPRPSLLDEFLKEFPSVWRQIPDKGLFMLLLVGWVLFFEFLGNSTLGYIDARSIYAWTSYSYLCSEDDEHGFLIPFVVLGLFWWKRHQLRDTAARNWLPALSIVLLATLIHIAGYVVQQTRVSLVGFFLGIYGLIGMVWGPAVMRASFFPMCLFVFALPLGTLAETITFPLRMIATSITTGIVSGVLGIDVIRKGTQIFDPLGKFQYEVAAACGGLRSLTAILALSTIYGFMNFKCHGRRAIMMIAAFPLALAGNVLRLTTIILVAEAFGQQYGNWIHDSPWFSMLPYLPALGGMVVLGHFLQEKPEGTPPGDSAPSSPPVGQPA